MAEYKFLFAEHAVILVVVVSFDDPDFILGCVCCAHCATIFFEVAAALFGILDARGRCLEGKLNICFCYSDSRSCSWLRCNLFWVEFGNNLIDILYKIVPLHQGSHFQKHRQICNLVLVSFLRVESLS